MAVPASPFGRLGLADLSARPGRIPPLPRAPPPELFPVPLRKGKSLSSHDDFFSPVRADLLQSCPRYCLRSVRQDLVPEAPANQFAAFLQSCDDAVELAVASLPPDLV